MNPEQEPAPVSREELRALLDRWRAGVVNEQRVHGAAEDWYEKYGDASDSNEDEGSIGFEVVSQLSALNVQLITKDDVPAFLEFLAAPPGGELPAWEKWLRYWDGIDYERRPRNSPTICTTHRLRLMTETPPQVFRIS